MTGSTDLVDPEVVVKLLMNWILQNLQIINKIYSRYGFIQCLMSYGYIVTALAGTSVTVTSGSMGFVDAQQPRLEWLTLAEGAELEYAFA